jgi:outer membrane protein assembly factor BamA
VPSKLIIQRGNLFTVKSVSVEGEGLSKGALRVANAVYQPAAGYRYAPKSLDIFTRRALDTGLYERLDVTPIAVGPDELELRFKGEDAKPKTLGFFGGYETFTGPIVGTEYRNVNFHDTGDTVGAKAEYNARGINGNLQWIDPAFLESKYSLNLQLSATTFTFKAYERQSAALQATLVRRFSRQTMAELFAGYNVGSADSDQLTPEELGPDSYSFANIGARLTLDHRDNPLTPHRGWIVKGAVEGGSGDINYLRYDLAASYYKPFSEKFRFAVGARSSAFSSQEDITEIPIDLRLFNGGANSVRSFPERELGPISMDGNTPLGGTATAVLNAEFSYEVISNLEIAVFADAGSLSTEDSSVFSGGDWRYAVGLGVRYNLPIGPLRIDYGVNPSRKPGDPFGALHITFGFAF